MVWAICALVAIGAGLPLIAWLTTRGLARRPPAPLEPYHGRVERWIHQHYQLDWPECSLVQGAVTLGLQVSEPGLEDATHWLAAATLREEVPGVRRARLATLVNLILGPAMVASGIGIIFMRQNPLFSVYFITEGVLFFMMGWLTFRRIVTKQRTNAARALELNRPAATPSA